MESHLGSQLYAIYPHGERMMIATAAVESTDVHEGEPLTFLGQPVRCPLLRASQ